MGARISGHGTHTIDVDGVERLHGTEYEIIPDRLEAGTFSIAAAMTRRRSRGDAAPARSTSNRSPTSCARPASRWRRRTTSSGSARTAPLRPLAVQALPYPGLATDLQALVAVLLTQAHGVSYLHERVFDNRLLYVGELRKLGAE